MSRLVASLLALLALVTGCATVPGSSDVHVLRRVGDAAEPSAPPGPVRGAGPLETVRGWVVASGATAQRHEAARAFLTPQAAGGWDDGAAATVVSDQVDTVFAGTAGPAQPGQSAVRVRANRLGILSPEGAFVPQPGQVDEVVQMVSANGQWRIAELPGGTLVRRSDLRANTRPLRAWFVDAVRGTPVAERRYLATSPARSVAGRAVQLLLAGPSSALSGAAVNALPPGAGLATPTTVTNDGNPVVDLTRVGALDDTRRRQIAEQVCLTLAGVGVMRVRLLVDGVPLLGDRPDVSLAEVLGSLPPGTASTPDLPVDTSAAPPAAPPASPPLLVVDGRVRALSGDPVDGPAGSGTYDVRTAAAGDAGRVLAVVAGPGRGASSVSSPAPLAPPLPAPGLPPAPPPPPRLRLLAGPAGAELAPTGVEGTAIGQPTWTPGGREVWTVVDGNRVARAVRAAGPDASSGGGSNAAPPLQAAPLDAAALTGAAGPAPVTALALSPDGVRVAAVAGGRVLVGAVARDGAGDARIGSVEVLRPDALTGVLDVAWSRTDQLLAVGTRADRPVSTVTVDGLDLDAGPTTNLTPPVTAVAAYPGRSPVVVDASGTWMLPADSTDPGAVWHSVPGAGPGAVPGYPG